MKTLLAVRAFFALFLAAVPLAVMAQIQIGPGGSAVQTFATQPTLASGWSGGFYGSSALGFTSTAALDAHVVSNTAAGAINTPLPSSATQPPAQNSLPRWNSTGFYLQSKPTGNDYLILMAHLRNATGSNVTHVVVRYDWDQKVSNPVGESVPGYRAFYSISGLPQTWTLIPELSTFTVNSTAQTLQALVPLGVWTNGADLYLIWADDNGPGSLSDPQEGAYTIDNFSVSAIPATTPLIIEQPQNQSVAPGNPVLFTVSAIGAPPLSFRWRKDEAEIQFATNQTFAIEAAQTNDAGAYSVMVSNAFGVTVSTQAILTVACTEAPSLVGQLVSTQILSGGALLLNAIATGTKPLLYQWLWNGAALPSQTNATLNKADVQSADSGFYAVRVSNCFGSVTSSNVAISIANTPYALVALTNHAWKYESSGTDLGDAWKAPAYDDSFWPQGLGLFAREDSPPVSTMIRTPLSLTSPSRPGGISTYYFRTQFVLTNDPRDVVLVASNYVDDGAVWYLNGAEAFRFNMSPMAVTYDTLALAANPLGEGIPISSNLPSAQLLMGTNTLTVSVHQNSLTSSDIVFGTDLRVMFHFPVPLEFIQQPEDVIAFELQSFVLSGAVSGAAHYRWFKDGVLLPQAITPQLPLVGITLADQGQYVLVASNAINVVTSRVATVEVLQDTKPLRLLSADVLDSTHVLVSFDKLLSPNSAAMAANYSISNTSGAGVAVTQAVVTNGTNVLLTTGSLAVNANFILTASGVTDVAAQPNVLSRSAVPIARLLSLVSFDSQWSFYDPWPAAPLFEDPDPGPGWQLPGYENPIWGAGQAAFWNWNDLNYVPPVPPGTALDQTPAVASYFRHEFTSSSSPGGLRLRLRFAVADGAVFYLNGAELHRFNMPSGLPTFQTPASQPTLVEVPLLGVEVEPDSLPGGQNLFAAEVHQVAPGDINRFFAAELTARAESLLVGPVKWISGPDHALVLENRPVSFRVSQAGAGHFQWQMNGTNLPGATNAVLTIPATPLAYDRAQVRVVFGRTGQSSVTSSTAILRVMPDLDRPHLVSAHASGGGTLTVSFSEAIELASATNAANYLVTNGLGEVVGLSGIQIINASNVVLQLIGAPAGRFGVVVNNVRDNSVSRNQIAIDSAIAASFRGTVIPADATWRFDSAGVDRGPSSVWAAPAYDDSIWSGQGQALFAAERGVAPNGSGGAFPAYPEPVRTSLTLSNQFLTAQLPTYYFRTRFVTQSGGNGSLILSPIADDGAVYYLNGVEIFRLGVAGAVNPTYGTLANRTVGDALYEGSFTVTVTNLIAGTNVLAVLASQVNTTSADFAFGLHADLAFNGEIITAPVEPALRLTSMGEFMVLSWEGVGYLQATESLTEPWQIISSESPHVVGPTNAAQFFKLRR